VEGSSRSVRSGGMRRGQVEERMVSEEECSTAQEKMVSEYGFSYFHGLEERSISLRSNFFGGAEEGIAARLEGVMVDGFDFWKSGRMNDWRMVAVMKAGAVSWVVWGERRVVEMERVRGEDQGSWGEAKARRERRIDGSRSWLVGLESEVRLSSWRLVREVRPRVAACRVRMSALCREAEDVSAEI
jgi:hypothetical protein